MALVKPSSSWWTFFPVSSSIPYNCFLCWKYGRPLDFCLKIFWQSVNSFLFRRKVHKTVSLLLLSFWFLLKPVARGRFLDFCIKFLLKLVNLLLLHLSRFFFPNRKYGQSLDFSLRVLFKFMNFVLFHLKLYRTLLLSWKYGRLGIYFSFTSRYRVPWRRFQS